MLRDKFSEVAEEEEKKNGGRKNKVFPSFKAFSIIGLLYIKVVRKLLSNESFALLLYEMGDPDAVLVAALLYFDWGCNMWFLDIKANYGCYLFVIQLICGKEFFIMINITWYLGRNDRILCAMMYVYRRKQKKKRKLIFHVFLFQFLKNCSICERIDKKNERYLLFFYLFSFFFWLYWKCLIMWKVITKKIFYLLFRYVLHE